MRLKLANWLSIFIGDTETTARIVPIDIVIDITYYPACPALKAPLVRKTERSILKFIALGGAGVNTLLFFAFFADFFVDYLDVGSVVNHIPVQKKLIVYIHFTILHAERASLIIPIMPRRLNMPLRIMRCFFFFGTPSTRMNSSAASLKSRGYVLKK